MDQQTTPAKFIVFCGDPAVGGHQFTYAAVAPTVLCTPHTDEDSKPDRDDTGVFLTSLVEAHHNEILQSQAWRCVSCNKPAKELLHCAVPLLSPHKPTMLPGFEPTVIDIASPICISGGACDRKAEEAAHKVQKEGFITKPWQEFDDSKTCDRCGRKSGVKLCGGCKVIAYCSKECQTESWPGHKKQCKRAKQERAAESGF
ncbi:hypothetical protein IFR04_003368 [Cadophora malorum]|uniref:MYND-type domain-containing protein n=1 Tax=Cadophora malorum TaxID=108018 RepID=A0A8H8BTI2_9HELO|nr:hypothetical protein IFR04_003368 [Cadophora malorum]